MDYIIKLDNISKKLGFTWAIKNITLKIPSNSIVAITGPNGSGKSTLLKIIAGIWSPNRGKISVLGGNPREINIKRNIGIVLHESLLYDELTVEENLEFFTSFYDKDWRENRLLDYLNIQRIFGKRVYELSYGWRKRVDLARAIAHNPQLLLIDEPFTGLDFKGRESLRKIIVELFKSGRTILLAAPEFNDNFLSSLNSIVITLVEGKIKEMVS